MSELIKRLQGGEARRKVKEPMHAAEFVLESARDFQCPAVLAPTYTASQFGFVRTSDVPLFHVCTSAFSLRSFLDSITSDANLDFLLCVCVCV